MPSHKKIAVITVPYITGALHRSWAERTMQSVWSSHELYRIAVINACRTEDRDWIQKSFDCVLENDKNILARAFNRGISEAAKAGAHYYLIINLDVVLHSACIDELVAVAEARPEALVWSAVRWPSLSTLPLAKLDSSNERAIEFSCFMCDQRLPEMIGAFDERFEPAYYEDCDMRYRLDLASAPYLKTHRALFFHLERGTLKGQLGADGASKTTEVMSRLDDFMSVNMTRYVEKWGGKPLAEKFRSPFGK